MSNWKTYVIGSWSWKRPLYSILSVYILLLIVVLFFAEKLIFFPPDSNYADTLNSFKLLKNEKDQDVAAFYKKAAIGMPTILWSHGNSEDISTGQQYMNYLCKHGFGILNYDYPGYGLSDGKTNEAGCYLNIQAAWNHLTQELNIPEDQIVLVGQSVGTGPTVWLAEKNNPAGIALISPFKSINRVPFNINPFPYDRFPNIKRIHKVSSPLLVIHGENDTVIKQSHGRALYKKHRGEKTFYNAEGREHNDLFSDPKVNTTLTDFVRAVTKKQK